MIFKVSHQITDGKYSSTTKIVKVRNVEGRNDKKKFMMKIIKIQNVNDKKRVLFFF